MSHSESFYAEKRDFIRMKIELPLSGTLTNDSGRITGQCHELSGGGLQLELPEAVAVESQWELHLSAEHDERAQLRAVVKVVRCTTEGDHFSAGLQIVQVIE
ncbi:PilZ domain-containing protein [Gilvimarinus agarilyticus]|uniref:PilZ domain-containing protein n=1 Tax=Gilvimarinus agarilyticus TaxID=679259 RepID=UPI0005A021DF|nr:PilZ domain-containing protein [Gilvimarinus agarilyticus]